MAVFMFYMKKGVIVRWSTIGIPIEGYSWTDAIIVIP